MALLRDEKVQISLPSVVSFLCTEFPRKKTKPAKKIQYKKNSQLKKKHYNKHQELKYQAICFYYI